MNINQSINKLLLVLAKKRKLYKINSFQFYNEDLGKYCTKYQIIKRIIIIENEEIIEEWNVDEICYSKINVLKYLINEHKGSEADAE